MNWIKDFMVTLLLSVITGDLLILLWVLIGFAGRGRIHVRYMYFLLRTILAAYLFPPVYLLIKLFVEHVRGEYDIMALSNEATDRLFSILFTVWLAGVIFVLLYGMRTWIYFRRIRKNAMPVPKKYQSLLQELCARMGIRRQVALYQGYGVKTPFITGIWKTRIYLPVNDFAGGELEMILYHELIHYRQGDVLWKPLFGLIGNVYWFNPLSGLLWDRVVHFAEASCDFCCYEDRFLPKAYFKLLFEMSTGCCRMGGCVPMWSEEDRGLKWRIECMKRYRRKKVKHAVIGLIAAGSILVSGISTCAAVRGMELFYGAFYWNTVEETEEPLQEPEELQEYEGTLDDLEGTQIIEHTEESNARSTVGTFQWSVGNNETHMTGKFKVSAGGKIVVSVGITPGNKQVKVGLVKPDRKVTYVKGSGVISHTFTAPETGYYQISITNTSGTRVEAAGSYIR